MLGRRRSASTNSTRAPFCASTTAVLMLVVVLPSCGSALVTRMTFGGAPVEERRMEVRSARYDSTMSDRGRSQLTIATDSAEDGSAGREDFPITSSGLDGITPSVGNPVSI